MTGKRWLEFVVVVAVVALVVGRMERLPAVPSASRPSKMTTPSRTSTNPTAPANVEDPWNWYTEEGKKIYDEGYQIEKAGNRELAYAHYAMARSFYDKALEVINDPLSSRRERSLENCRWICVSQELWRDEEPYTRELVSYWEQTHDPTNPVMLGQAHYQMAKNFDRQRIFEKSNYHFAEAVKYRDASKSGRSWVYYDNYARMLKRWKRTDRAEEMFQLSSEQKLLEESK